MVGGKYMGLSQKKGEYNVTHPGGKGNKIITGINGEREIRREGP